MKTIHRLLMPILCFLMISLLVSCAAYRPSDSTVKNMSVEEAHKVLATQLKNGGEISGALIADVRVTSNRLIVTDRQGERSIFIFKNLPEIICTSPMPSESCLDIELSTQPKGRLSRYFSGGFSRPTLHDIANALYVLKQNAINLKRDADEFDANFGVSLAEYRKKAVSNATLPEEVNRYKVQAEGAVRDKDLDEAADFYAKALKIVPWWPAGHFNRALVLGETGDYGDAMREMKYYLQLVPDAPNARAAQDKIYDWERLNSR